MATTTRTFRSGGHTLVGTLTTPPAPGTSPGVLLVPGSGPVDRDSNHKRLPLGITGQLAAALAEAGFATYRYDKRGVGESTGTWRAAGFHDNVDDARAALDALRGAPGVDPRRTYVLGHSEGALLATAIAATDPDVAGILLLSPSAQPGEAVLRWQAARLAPTLPAPVRAVLRLLRTDLEKKVAKNHVKIKATTTDVAWVDGARLNARWHREFLAYDPRPDLARIAAPVLAMTGSKDLQVDPADLDTIAALVPGPVETRVLPDVTHILRTQPGPPSLSRYKEEVRRPVDPAVVEDVTRWLSRQAEVAAPR